MRVLVLSDKLFSRTLGDGLRVHGFFTPLLERHSFDLLCFGRTNESLEADVRALFRSVEVLPYPASRSSDLTSLGQAALWSIENFKPHSEAMRAAIASRCASGKYDIVLDVAANMLPNIPRNLKIPLIVDSIDEPLLRDLRAFKTAPISKRPRLAYQILQYWRYAHAFLGQAAVNIYASEFDVETQLRYFPGRRAIAIANGVDIDYFSPTDAAAREPATVAFEGNLMFGPNVDAARQLVMHVLPELKTLIPKARVMLIGRDPAPAVRALASDSVEVTGTLSDIRPALARATVFACPMTLGSGIKNKILQAWSLAMPVVATTASLGGLSAKDGENLMVRDNPVGFAAALAEIIRDPTLSRRLGNAGRSTVVQRYSWRSKALEFESALSAAVTSTPLQNPR